MTSPVALGFRVHSGWAALIALGGARSSPDMVERTPLVLIDEEAGGAAQPYHAAADMDPAEAETYISMLAPKQPLHWHGKGWRPYVRG